MAASILAEGPIPLDKAIYPEICLHNTRVAYQEFLVVECMAEDDATRIVGLTVLPTFSSEAARLRQEFLNYILDLSVQYHLNRQ